MQIIKIFIRMEDRQSEYFQVIKKKGVRHGVFGLRLSSKSKRNNNGKAQLQLATDGWHHNTNNNSEIWRWNARIIRIEIKRT